MPDASDDAAAYYATLGPWWATKAIEEYCKLTEQEVLQWTESQKLLGVKFADGKYYYPARQFKDGGPLVGLDRILAVLAPAYGAPESQTAWLADEAYVGGDVTRWDLLRHGDVDLLLGWGKADVAWMLDNEPTS